MRSKPVVLSVMAAILTLASAVAAPAQRGKDGYAAARLASGIALTFMTETDPPSSRGRTENSIYVKGDIIHRVLADYEAGTYFGYDVEVERAAEAGQYKVIIKQLSIKPTLNGRGGRTLAGAHGGGGARAEDAARTENAGATMKARPLPTYPEPQVVSEGDTIALDVLVNPQTGVKIVDYIKVSSDAERLRDSVLQSLAAPQPARDFTVDAVEMRVTNFRLLINGEPLMGEGKSFEGGLAGSLIWFYVSGRGRFIFSLSPREGYNFQKVGVIEYNKIAFTINGDRYEWQSSSPIVGKGGNWNLWVLHDNAYRPDVFISESDRFQFGAADLPEYLLKKE